MATDSEEMTMNLSREASVENLPASLEEETSTVADQFLCPICNEKYQTPRLLHCLHVFCSPCLDKLVENVSGNSSCCESVMIACPACKQVTRVATGITDLVIDVILINMIEMVEIRTQQVRCTSCKAEEKAVARCSDCSSFLCPSCVTAHNYMRCFENHKVETFDELCKDESRGIHKPMFCNHHSTESLKYFCNSCEVPVCGECMVSLHKIPEHQLEPIAESKNKHLDELNDIMKDTKTKISVCEDASGGLESLLSDLQQQHDNANDLINETFHSYKAILEKCKDSLLGELENVHSRTELAIMEMFHNLEKTVDKIEDGSKFTERVLKNGNAVEVLLMKRHIKQQMLTLLNNTPRPEMNIKIEFVTDADKFAKTIKESFGNFKMTDDTDKAGSMHSSFEGEHLNSLLSGHHQQQVITSEGILTPLISSAEYMPSLPNVSALSHSSPLPDLTASTIITSLSNMSMHHHTLGPHLHSLPYGVERSLSRNSYSPSMSDSGISVDAVSSQANSTGQNVLNLQALMKMGSLGVNAQGQITVNGQTIPGLNLSSVGGGLNPPQLSPALQSRVHMSLPSVQDQTLAGFLNSVGALTPNPMSPANQLNDISALFNSLPAHQSLALRSASPITAAAAAAAANLLSAPPPVIPLNGGIPVPNPSPISFNGGGGGGVTGGSLCIRNPGKISAMDIRCKFGQLGPGKGQFNSPHGFCLGMDEDIVVADTNNHRIQVFEKTGEFKYQFGIPGREEGQLWYPRKVAVIRTTGKYVVCDRGSERSRMQLFTKNGQFIKKIAIRYIDIVAGLAITGQGHIVAVDSVSPTVFCISESGDLIKWFDCSDYMREPSDIAVNGKDYYVCDFKGHCVVVFNEEGQFLHRIGCENITNYPNGIDISDAGDVLIGDSHGNRFHVAVFQRDGHLIGEFECPYVKVSRCCGLKITSEGYVVTLAKNNQHVLVLNTLYIA